MASSVDASRFENMAAGAADGLAADEDDDDEDEDDGSSEDRGEFSGDEKAAVSDTPLWREPLRDDDDACAPALPLAPP